MTATVPRPWPFDALLDASGCATASELGHKLNLSGTSLFVGVHEGLSDKQADRWATKLGLHPEMVWPGWCAAALTPHDEAFVWGGEGREPGWRQAAIWCETRDVSHRSPRARSCTIRGENECSPRPLARPGELADYRGVDSMEASPPRRRSHVGAA